MTYDGVMDRPTYIDIDGTITDLPGKQGGNPIQARLELIKEMIAAGKQVVIWSGGGTAYVKRFCLANGIVGATMIGKPELVVDDNPDIRPKGRMRVMAPEKFFG